MGYVITLEDFTPGQRYDGTPWTDVRWEESETSSDGPFGPIETQPLVPVDADPENPQSRDLTTTEASISEGWFRLVFLDADGNEQPAAAVYFPGPAEVEGPLSLEEFKQHLDRQLDADDELLERFLAAAFLQAQAPPPYGCGRLLIPDPPAGGDPVTRAIRLRGARRRVMVPDAREITAVTVDDAAATWEVGLERDGHIVQIDFPDLAAASDTAARRTVEVTGRFGFAALPVNLKNAIYVLAARAAHERDAAYADQVTIAEGAGVQTYYRQLPPATKLAFSSYALASGHAGLS